MKSILSILSGLILVSSIQANACLNSNNMTICPGDRATVDWLSGSVLGVNPIKKMVSIRFDNGQTGTYPISRVSVGKGCLHGYCVGDRATVGWLSGRIVGINPVFEEISIYFDNGQTGTYDLEGVSIGKGCIQGYCVDDRVTIEWLSGKIIGVNPRTNEVSVYFDNGQIGTYDIDRVSINSYCLQYPEMHQYRSLSSREDFSQAFNR